MTGIALPVDGGRTFTNGPAAGRPGSARPGQGTPAGGIRQARLGARDARLDSPTAAAPPHHPTRPDPSLCHRERPGGDRDARYEYVTVNVFTDERFGGNPLAVFPDARGLTDAQMQAIAARVQSVGNDLRAAAGQPAAPRQACGFSRPRMRCRSPAIPMSAPASCWLAR